MLGLLAVADPVKPTAAQALSELRALGIDLAMVTGDREGAAQAVARALGISRVHAGVLPGDKSKVVAQEQAAGRLVGMVGDGINDAPALARADVGIA
jgi:P-type E1-E2 ATPase